MLEFIYGRAGTGKTNYCLESIKKELLAHPMGPQIILLLPEHITYKVERQIATMMAEQGSGFVRLSVYGFRRFAYQVLAEMGGGLEPGLTELGKQLLLKKVLNNRLKKGKESEESSLQAFNKSARQRGFVKALGQMLDELKCYNVSPEQLSATVDLVDDKRLQGKLNDLSILARDYSEQMEGHFQDKSDTINRMLEKLPSYKLLDGAEIWLDGFLFFNPQEQLVIKEFIQRAANVHITLTIDPVNLHRNWENSKPTGIFYHSYQTLRVLQDIGTGIGCETVFTPLKKNSRHVNVPLQRVQSDLYTFRKKDELAELSADEQMESVKVIEAANSRLEIEAVAADIRRLVREQGYKWHDIGILIRDEDTYGSVLPMVLKDYDIPYFSDSKRPCANHPLAELIRSAIDVVNKGWGYESIFRCLKTGFFSLTMQDIDLLENYVLEFGIRGYKRWTADDWTAVRRFEIDDDTVTEEQELRLARINHLRKQVIVPLSKFHTDLHAAQNMAEATKALYMFMMEISVPESLEQWAVIAEESGRLADAKEHAQVWHDVVELLDQLVELSGDETFSMKKMTEYESILSEGLDALQVSLIPPGLDYVTIARFDRNSLDNLRAIYILGVSAGSMPRRTSESAILSDADRLKLEELAKKSKDESMVQLSVVARDNSFNEKYLIYKAFTQPREYLCLSYPLADTNGNGVEPASLIKRVRTILPSCNFLYIPLESMEWRDDLQKLMLAEGRSALSALVPALRNSREKHVPLNDLWKQVYNWGIEENKDIVDNIRDGIFYRGDKPQLPKDIARLLFTKKNILKTSVSRLESYNNCPFKFFSQYGLKLEERQEYKFRSMDFGKLLHAVLQEFGLRMKKENRRWGSVPEDECKDICKEILYDKAEKLQNGIMLSSKQKTAQLERIYRTACRVLLHQCAFDKASKFHPAEFEEKFDTSYNKNQVEMLYQLLDDCKLAIRGTIDRIDRGEDGTVAENWFSIVDYKTSDKDLSIGELYYGLNMQLITYLLVAQNILQAQEGKEVLPAAMLYALLSPKIITDSGKRFTESEAEKELLNKLRMKGWLNWQDELLEAMDPDSQFVVAKTQKGAFTADTQKRLFQTAEFKRIIKHVEKLLKDTGNAIISGKIDIDPVKCKFGTKEMDACKYCGYKAVCGFSADIEGFKKRYPKDMKKDEVMAEIERTEQVIAEDSSKNQAVKEG